MDGVKSFKEGSPSFFVLYNIFLRSLKNIEKENLHFEKLFEE